MAYYSSTLLRRWISSSKIFRPRSLSTAAAAAASSSSAAPPPWLILRELCDKEGEIYFRFQCCSHSSKIYSFLCKGTSPPINSKAKFVGSSHGWLALHDNEDKRDDLFLSDPTVPRHIKLPPLRELRRIILSEREGRAFVVSGDGRRLAFCSPLQSSEWTPFGGGGGGAYESIVYSSSHRRLLCLTSTFRLEAWDVAAGELPGLDWAAQLETPGLHKQQPGLTTLTYLVCWEASGDLFVVVRRVDPSRGRFVEAGAVSEFAHPTVGFEVYKVVDREGRRVARMAASLEGLTMFVGMNHPFAIKGVEGVKPNAIYFAYDKLAGDNIDHRDFGIFDYQNKCVYQQESHYLPDDLVSEPIWFIPHRHDTI